MAAYSVDFRAKIVAAYEEGKTSIRKVAERFMVSKGVVQRLIKQNAITGDITPRKPGGAKPSQLVGQEQAIAKMVGEHPDWTLQQYCDHLAAQTEITVSISVMCRYLQQQNLTLKKKTFRSTQAITDEGQQKRLDYWRRIRGVDPDNLIFIDEMGVLLGLESTCSRSLKGQRAYTLKPFYRGTKITVIGAITNQGVLAMQTMPGSMKGDDFRTFMQNQVVPKLELGKVVVMDNLPAHKVKGIEEMITATGARVEYMSPYSPDFNPIEMLWSQLKAFLRRFAPKALETIDKLLNIAMLLSFPQHFQNWFTYCCYCTS